MLCNCVVIVSNILFTNMVAVIITNYSVITYKCSCLGQMSRSLTARYQRFKKTLSQILMLWQSAE